MMLGPRSDSNERARSLIDALDELRTHAATRRYKQRSVELCSGSARRILDVGCGTGDDVLALAEAAGPASEVVGVDHRWELIAEAERRARNVALNVHFSQADARALPFASKSFDLVRADRLLEEVADVGAVLRELVRVLCASGRILLHHVSASAVPLRQHDVGHQLALSLSALGVRGVELMAEPDLVVLGEGSPRVLQGVTVLGTKVTYDPAETAGD
jgi:ubiquinone/menaquinone biosynthesis C-methylase UbiE